MKRAPEGPAPWETHTVTGRNCFKIRVKRK